MPASRLQKMDDAPRNKNSTHDIITITNRDKQMNQIYQQGVFHGTGVKYEY
jgi:hypothetical protein